MGVDSEKAYIEAVLYDNGVIGMSPVDCGQLDQEMFTTYRPIYERIMELSTKGKVRKTDLMFTSPKNFQPIIAELEPYTSATWEYHHRQIFQTWAQGVVSVACRQANEEKYPASQDTLERALSTLSMKDGGSKTVTAGEVVTEVMEAIVKRIKDGGKIPGLKFGLPSIDTATLGAKDGDFIVICARPSEGKSAIGGQIAREFAKTVMTGVITLADSKEELVTRGLAAESGIDSRALSTGIITGDEKMKLRDGVLRFETFKNNLLIHEKPGISLPQLLGEIRSMHRRGAKAVIVDYLQIVKVKGDQPKHEKVGEVSISVKALARELKIPIIALAQLKRLDSTDRRPSLNDIQHSDQPGQDADQCWFIYHQRDKEGRLTGRSWIIVAKARNGAVCDVEIIFDRPTLTIREGRGDERNE